MPRAEEVNPSNFEVQRVLYDDGTFSLVWGRYLPEDNLCVGIRWNETSTSSLGHPSVRGHAMWFVLPDAVAVGALRQLVDEPASRLDALVPTLRDLVLRSEGEGCSG